MCGRFTLTSDLQSLQVRFGFHGDGLPYVPRYNVAPAQEVLVVFEDEEVKRAEFMHWGLIPSWAKEQSIGRRMINARVETVSEKPSFRAALRKRRCLILADGFYEWKKEAGRKIPMRIVLKSGEPFALAGLWDTWVDSSTGELIPSCTIITTVANSFMQAIHHRMPVILLPEMEQLWLDLDVDDPGVLLNLLTSYPGQAMNAYPVSTLVNSTRNDSLACIDLAN